MRDIHAHGTAEEELPELSYLLSLPAGSSADERVDFQDATVAPNCGKKTATHNLTTRTALVRSSIKLCSIPSSSAGFAGGPGPTAGRKWESRPTFAEDSRLCYPKILHQQLQLPLEHLPQWQTQPTPHQRENKCQQARGSVHKRGSLRATLQQQQRPPDKPLQKSNERHRPATRAPAASTIQQLPTSAHPVRPTRSSPAASAARQRTEKVANDSFALQRQRREAVAAATARSKIRLEAYRQWRKLLAAKQAAAQRKAVKRSRLQYLERFQQQQAKEEQWREHQHKEEMWWLQMQQEFEQRKAARTLHLQVLQAARAAAARRILAAERAACAAVAEDRERRRECVRRIEHVRSAARSKAAAAALHRKRIFQAELVRQQLSVGQKKRAPPQAGAHTGAQTSVTKNPGYAGDGEMPRLLSRSTARRIALRRQDYSTSFLHRLAMDGGANRVLEKPAEEVPAIVRRSPLSAAASSCGPCRSFSTVSSKEAGTNPVERHPDVHLPLPSPSSSMVPFPATVCGSRIASFVTKLSPAAGGFADFEPTGEGGCGDAADSCCVSEQRRLGEQSNTEFGATPGFYPLVKPASSDAVAASKNYQEGATAATAAAAVNAALACTSRRMVARDTICHPPATDTHQPAERLTALQSGNNSTQHVRKDDVYSSSNTASAAVATTTSTATTFPAGPHVAAQGRFRTITNADSRTTQEEVENMGASSALGSPSRVVLHEKTWTNSPANGAPGGEGSSRLRGFHRRCSLSVLSNGEREGRCFAIGTRSNSQDGETLSTAFPDPENEAIAEVIGAEPQPLQHAVELDLPFSTAVAKSSGNKCSDKRMDLALARSCPQINFNHYNQQGTNSESCVWDVASIDLDSGANTCSTIDSGSNTCSMQGSSNTCSSNGVGAWPSGGEHTSYSHLFSEDARVSPERSGVASATSEVGISNCSIQFVQHTREVLPRDNRNVYTSLAATSSQSDASEAPSKDDVFKLRLTTAATFSIGRIKRDTHAGFPDGWLCAKPSKEEALSLSYRSLISSQAECAESVTAASPEAERACALTERDAVRCPDSTAASPEAFGSHGTPIFGQRFAVADRSLPVLPGSPGKRRADGVFSGSEDITKPSGYFPPMQWSCHKIRQAQEHERQQKQQVRQPLKLDTQNSLNQAMHEKITTQREQQHLSAEGEGASSGEQSEQISDTPLLAGGTNAVFANSAVSQATHSDIGNQCATSFLPPHDADADAGFSKVYCQGCSEKPVSDFSEHACMQQQNGAWKGAKSCEPPLLVLHPLSQKPNSLYSSSDSSELNDSIGCCWCYGGRALQGRHRFFQERDSTVACSSPVIEFSRQNGNSSTKEFTASSRCALGYNATARAVTACGEFPTLEGKGRVSRRSRKQLRWQYLRRIVDLRGEAPGEQVLDGAEADAESSFASADEAEVCPNRQRWRDEADQLRSSKPKSVRRTNKPRRCRLSSDDTGALLPIESEKEGSLAEGATLAFFTLQTPEGKSAAEAGTALRKACGFPRATEYTSPAEQVNLGGGAGLRNQLRSASACEKNATRYGNTTLEKEAPRVAANNAPKGRPRQRIKWREDRIKLVEECAIFFEQRQHGEEPKRAWKKKHLFRHSPSVYVHQSPSSEVKRPHGQRLQWQRRQQNQSHLDSGNGGPGAERNLQGLSVRRGVVRAAAATSLGKSACQGQLPRREAAATALLDEFLRNDETEEVITE